MLKLSLNQEYRDSSLLSCGRPQQGRAQDLTGSTWGGGGVEGARHFSEV